MELKGRNIRQANMQRLQGSDGPVSVNRLAGISVKMVT